MINKYLTDEIATHLTLSRYIYMYTTDKTCGHKLYWVLENRHLIYYVSVMLHNNSEAIIRMEVDMPYGNTSKYPRMFG